MWAAFDDWMSGAELQAGRSGPFPSTRLLRSTGHSVVLSTAERPGGRVHLCLLDTIPRPEAKRRRIGRGDECWFLLC